MPFAHPEFLVETDWLADHLSDPDLRILDCTVFLRSVDDKGHVIRARESGRAHWEAGHIPGASFVDLLEELSDTSSPYLFMLPSAEQFAAAMGRHGVGEGTRVVLYDAAHTMWAARVWWMLRTFGFDNAAVLNGGWRKWTREGRPVSTEPSTYPPSRFVPRPRPELIATKDEVIAAMEQGGVCLMNALTADQHRGDGPSPYGRPGHIPTSVNLAAREIVDPATHAYLPEADLRARFTAAGTKVAGKVITYCGGGIAASSNAFVLTLLGHENVAVYDGSLSEWTADPALPLETGD